MPHKGSFRICLPCDQNLDHFLDAHCLALVSSVRHNAKISFDTAATPTIYHQVESGYLGYRHINLGLLQLDLKSWFASQTKQGAHVMPLQVRGWCPLRFFLVLALRTFPFPKHIHSQAKAIKIKSRIRK